MTPVETYVDDPTIGDDAILWRRIPPDWWIFDENTGRLRPTSKSFHDDAKGGPMSVLLKDILALDGRGPEDALEGHGGFALASITAGLARRLEQKVCCDPIRGEPAHGVVVGNKRKACKRFAAEAEWVIPPH